MRFLSDLVDGSCGFGSVVFFRLLGDIDRADWELFLGKVFIREKRSIEGHFVGIRYHVSSGNSFMASWVRVPKPIKKFWDLDLISYELFKAHIWIWKKIDSAFNPKIEIQSFWLTFGIRPFTSVHCSVAALDAALTQHPSSLQCWLNCSEYVQFWVFHKKLVSKNELNFCLVFGDLTSRCYQSDLDFSDFFERICCELPCSPNWRNTSRQN